MRLGLGLLLVFGCSPTTLEAGNGSTTVVNLPGAGGAREVVVVTDLDTTRDVSAGGGAVYVATDNGLLVYPAEGEPTPRRLTTADGLPSDDVTAVAVGADGRALAATESGLAMLEGTTVGAASMPAPPVGEVVDFLITDDNKLWACGVEGVARFDGSAWSKIGEDAHCTTLAGTPESHVWVGTTEGAWLIEGDVIREHGQGQGIPEGYVRQILPAAPDAVFALVQGPSYAQLALFDGERWFGYTIRDFDRVVAGLGLRGSELVLFTPGHVFALARGGTAEGVPLTAIHRGERFGVRSYRARVTPATEVTPAEVPADLNVRRAAQRLVAVPTGQPTIDAPRWVARPLSVGPQDIYLIRREGTTTYAADRNRGVVEMRPGATRLLRGKDLVGRSDLQVASDEQGNAWVVSPAGALGRWQEEGLVRVDTPDDVRPQAIASGPQGLYLLGQVGQSNTVRVYRRTGSDWAQVMERILDLGGVTLSGVPFIGVTNEGVVWAGVEIPHEDEDGRRARGVAVLDPGNEAIVYHYRNPGAAGGCTELSMPDEVSAIDTGDPGNIWIASFYGAIRIGNCQAVVFDETRGVRGEITSDVAVGNQGRVWVAAAEGVGFFADGQFDFRLPATVQQARPIGLAVDANGNLWAAGPRGALRYDGTSWTSITRENGLPNDDLVDVEVDAQDRVWFLATDQVMVFSRAASTESSP